MIFKKCRPLSFLFLIILLLSGCAKETEKKPITPDQSSNSSPKSYMTPYTSPSTSQQSYTSETSTIGQFSTRILDKSPGRVYNLNLASSKINNYTIQPGQMFSFNQVVGEADKDQGYKKAMTLDRHGNKQMDDGGGVCQISSTLYNAARNANLKIVERHSHIKDVGYVSKGNDAAISYGSYDLKFINTKDYPVIIKSSIGSKMVYVSIIKK